MEFSKKIKKHVFTARNRRMREGNVFTPVCPSVGAGGTSCPDPVCPGEGVPWPRDPNPQTRPSQGERL